LNCGLGLLSPMGMALAKIHDGQWRRLPIWGEGLAQQGGSRVERNEVYTSLLGVDYSIMLSVDMVIARHYGELLKLGSG